MRSVTGYSQNWTSHPLKRVERWPLKSDRIPSKKRLPDGMPFAWAGLILTRRKGKLISSARGGVDPTLRRGFWKRYNRRVRQH